MTIKLKPQHDAKARPQWRREQACSRGRADKSEWLHVHGMSACRGTLSDDDVELVVFERRVQEFFGVGCNR